MLRGKANTMWVLVLLAGLDPFAAAEVRDPYKYFFDQSLGHFNEELKLARDQGKKGILLFFEMDECPFCHYMKDNVLNQSEVQAFYKENFLNFSVDVEGDVEIVDFEGRTMAQKDFAFKINRVRATPVFAFYDLEGKRVMRYIGKTSGVREFMLLGQYVVDGAYKETKFTKYKRQRATNAD